MSTWDGLNEECAVYKDITDKATIYARVYFRFVTGFSIGNGDYLSLMSMYDGATKVFNFGLYRTGAQYQVMVNLRYGTYPHTETNITIAADTWYRWEACYVNNSGVGNDTLEGRVYNAAGELVCNPSTLMASENYDIDEVRVGGIAWGAAAPAGTAHIDDVAADANEWIGAVGTAVNTWQAACTTEPLQVMMDNARLVLGANQDSLADHEWFWASNVLYVRDNTGDPDGVVVIEAQARTYAIYVNNKDYVDLDNITCEEAKDVLYYYESDGGNITDCTAQLGSRMGLWLENSDSMDITDCYAYKNGAASGCGMITSGNAANNDFIDCTSTYNYEDGLQLDGGTGNTATGCTFTYNDESGGDAKANSTTWTNCNLSNNPGANGEGAGIVVNIGVTSTTITGCTITGNDVHGIACVGGSGHVWNYNTIYSNGSRGISFTGSTSGVISYNLVYGNTGHGIAAYSDATGLEFYNNVVYGNGGDGIDLEYGSHTVKNNIVSGNTGNVVSYKVATQTSNYNCLNGTGTVYRWGATTYPWANYLVASSQDANSTNADPVLTTPGSDFTLQVTSPCIGAGTDVSLTLDFVSTAVPQGTNPDMGAYEYELPAQAATPSPANAATNQAITVNLDWADAARAATYNVYLWLTSESKPGSPTSVESTSAYTIPGDLTNSAGYSWEIDTVNAAGTVDGIDWTFTTVAAVTENRMKVILIFWW